MHFSPDIPTHSPEQIFYFDDKGLIRRLDYSTVITKTTAAHYLHDHKNFSGLVVPTLRRAYFRMPDGRAQPEPVTVELGYSDLTLD